MAFLDVRRGWARQTAALAVAGLSLLLGCGDKEKGQTPPPAQSVDPWRHRAGAGTFVEPGTLIVNQPAAGTFTLAASGKAPPLVVSSQDYPGVVRVVGDLRDDINRVTGITPAVATDTVPAGASEVVLVGTIGLSPLIT